jgi:hypothetical protein
VDAGETSEGEGGGRGGVAGEGADGVVGRGEQGGDDGGALGASGADDGDELGGHGMSRYIGLSCWYSIQIDGFGMVVDISWIMALFIHLNCEYISDIVIFSHPRLFRLYISHQLCLINPSLQVAHPQRIFWFVQDVINDVNKLRLGRLKLKQDPCTKPRRWRKRFGDPLFLRGDGLVARL